MKTTIVSTLCMAMMFFGVSAQLNVLEHVALAHWVFTAAIFMIGGACALAFLMIQEEEK